MFLQEWVQASAIIVRHKRVLFFLGGAPPSGAWPPYVLFTFDWSTLKELSFELPRPPQLIRRAPYESYFCADSIAILQVSIPPAGLQGSGQRDSRSSLTPPPQNK
eukprot:1160992-Pelagomonas_calceolata.AAC.1